MLSGINTDIQYKGEVYHVQTEDGGANNPTVTTLLFKGGAIFSSKKTSYREIIQSGSYQEIVRELMKEQHKNMVRDLAAGKFERPAPEMEPKKAAENKDPKRTPGVDASDKAAPVQKGASQTQELPPQTVPKKPAQKKSLDDLILDYLSKKEETRD